jgi:hypothetical protein
VNKTVIINILFFEEIVMKKIIFEIVKRIILAICFVYAFDMVASGLEIFIPINFITIGVVASLGISGLLALIAVYFVLL